MHEINGVLSMPTMVFYLLYNACLGTYIPRKEVEVVETIRATVIKPNEAIKLRARGETKVSFGIVMSSGFSFNLDTFRSLQVMKKN